jgi:hypothetical protein
MRLNWGYRANWWCNGQGLLLAQSNVHAHHEEPRVILDLFPTNIAPRRFTWHSPSSTYRSCNTTTLEDKFHNLEYDTMKTSIFVNWLHALHHNVDMVLLAITFQFRLNQQPSKPHDLGSPAEFRQLFPRPQSYRDSTISTSWTFEIRIQYPLQ